MLSAEAEEEEEQEADLCFELHCCSEIIHYKVMICSGPKMKIESQSCGDRVHRSGF